MKCSESVILKVFACLKGLGKRVHELFSLFKLDMYVLFIKLFIDLVPCIKYCNVRVDGMTRIFYHTIMVKVSIKIHYCF